MNGSWVFANLPNLITLVRLLLTPDARDDVVSQRSSQRSSSSSPPGPRTPSTASSLGRFDLRSELAPISTRWPTRRWSTRCTVRAWR